MLKKMMLLAVAAAAIAAFAVPASASAADMWTANGEVLGEGEEASETYEGFLQFTAPSPPFPAHGTFGCDVTVEIVVAGTENGTGDGDVTKFTPTTESCEGTGLFAGCKLIHDTSNPPWDVNIGGTPLTVEGPITITNAYSNCLFGIPGSELTFEEVKATPTYGPNGISEISIAGTAVNGVIASGTVEAEGEEILAVDH